MEASSTNHREKENQRNERAHADVATSSGHRRGIKTDGAG